MNQNPEKASIDDLQVGTGASRLSPRVRRRALIVSILFHVVLLSVLLFWYFPPRDSGQTQAAVKGANPQTSGVSPTQAPERSVIDPVVPASQMEASVQSTLDQIKDMPEEQKLSELEKNLRRLDAISNEQSVGKTRQVIAETLDLEPGAEPLSEPPGGTFDAATAQIHNVIRERDGESRWIYKSVLVDSLGRTQTVVMPALEGETTYNTFEQMKKYPMAEGIYRQLVMPMLQKMIAATEVAEREALKAARDQEEGNADRLVEPSGGLPPEDPDAATADR